MKDMRMFDTYPDVVGVRQLQEMLGIGKNTAYALITENIIPHRRVGKQIKIAKVSIILYLLGEESNTE